jgi:hypothetical protein
VASDGALSVTNNFDVVVTEVNVAPVFVLTPTNRTIAELTLLTVTNVATDADIPVQTLSYTLTVTNLGGGGVVTNAAISTNGVITWTPTEAQGPSTNRFTMVASDGALSVTNEFDVVVLEVNVAPVFVLTPTNRTIAELTLLTVTNVATDADIPVQTLSYMLTVTNLGGGGAVTNAAISTNGVITWTPSGEQGPSTNRFTTVVSDGLASATNEFEVVVTEVNVAPVFVLTPTNRTIAELTLLTVTNVATDADIPVQTLSYTLTVTNLGGGSVVTNAAISTNGVITWTPTEAQGPSTNRFTTVVSDGLASATNEFEVVVLEVNEAPVLTLPANTNIMALVPWSALASATDADSPANTLSFELVSGPSGLTVATNGLIEWTPGADQGNSTNEVQIRVTDLNPAAVNATSLSVTSSFTIVVSPVLFVTANSTNRSFDQSNPAFTASFSGFVNGDDAGVLVGALEFSTPATNVSPAGVYPLQVAGVSSTNYAIVFVAGTLTVNPASATVSLLGLTQTYDGSPKEVEVLTTPDGLNVVLNYNGSPNAPTNVGSYEVIGTIVETNYVGSVTNTLTVIDSGPIVLTLGIASPGEVVVSWNSVSNLTYRLIYKDNVTDAEWTNLPPDITATGPISSVTNSVGSQPQRFYQIYLVP